MRSFSLTLLCVTATLFCAAQEISFRLAVYDKVNREPLAGVTVKLQDMSSLREYKMASDDSGYTNFNLSPAERYRVEVSAKDDGSGTGYLSYSYMLSAREATSKKTFVAELEKVKHTDSGLLPAMHFEYNNATLSSENMASLDNLLKMLQNFPSLQIEIGLYADCRENSLIVSKRATAITTYLNEKNAAKHAIVKEYGNVRALNQCDCSNTHFLCPESKYLENRRAEFKVIAF